MWISSAAACESWKGTTIPAGPSGCSVTKDRATGPSVLTTGNPWAMYSTTFVGIEWR